MEEEKNELYRFRIFDLKEETPCEDSPLPKARSGHRVVYNAGSIYSFGGFNPEVDLEDAELMTDPFWDQSRPLFKELWEFNLATKRWKKIRIQGDIPDQLASHTACSHPAVRDNMVIYGGTGSPFGTATSSSLVTCNLETGNFTRIPTLLSHGEPLALYGQAIVLDDKGCLYTVGGTTGFQYYMDVNRIDLTSRVPEWEMLSSSRDPEEPYPRYRHELCVYKNTLYVMGGGTSYSVFGFFEISTFSLDDNLWGRIKTEADRNVTIDMSDNGYPDPRRCHGTAQIDNQVYIFGGYDGDYIFDDIWKLDLDTLQWIRLPVNLNNPVYFHASTVSEEGKLLMFGGVDNIENNTRTNKVYSTWLKVPSLRSMSWEAVQHYIQDIGKIQPTALRELGIPEDCVKRVKTERALIG